MPNGSTSATSDANTRVFAKWNVMLGRYLASELDRTGLGLRLRYLSGGLSDEARTIDHLVLPERAGYFLGARMVQASIAARGLAWSVRAGANELAQQAGATAATA